jgi:hypothetical protein
MSTAIQKQCTALEWAVSELKDAVTVLEQGNPNGPAAEHAVAEVKRHLAGVEESIAELVAKATAGVTT